MTDTGLKWLSFFLGTGVLIFLLRLIFFSGKYCKTIDSLEDENSEINKKLDTLINCFNRLTGKAMLDDSSLKSFIDDNKDELIKSVESRKPQTNYDAEAASRSVMISLSGDPRLNKVKDYAFQNGKDLTMMLMAAGIYLRDLVLSKDITIKEQKK